MVVTLKQLLLYISAILVLMSCAKNDVPEDWEGEPVFVFNGSIGGKPVLYQAGVDGRKMHTDYFKDSTDLWAMRGVLAPRTCMDCPGSLEVSLYDEEPQPSVNKDRSAYTARPEWILPSGRPQTINDTIYVFTFVADTSNASPQNITWDFQNGDTSSQYAVERVFRNAPFTNVCLTYRTPTCSRNICNRIEGMQNRPCRIFFGVQQMSGNTYRFDAPRGVLWNFGDGGTAFNDTVVHTFASDTAIYRVCATLGGSCNTQFCRDIAMPQSAEQCAPGYNYTVRDSIEESTSPAGFAGKVVIKWTDRQGETYVNYRENRSPSSSEYVKAKHVEEYKKNSNGYPTKKITSDVDVWLFNTGDPTDSVALKANDFVFALPQP